MKKHLIGAVILTLCLLTACGETPREGDLTRTTYALGTVININLYDGGDDDLMEKLVNRITDIEAIMSIGIETSDISKVNAKAGIAPVEVSEETYKVLERALHYAALSEGRFDPTIGPIVGLWKIGTEEARVPESSEIEEALTHVDYKKVQLNPDKMTVYLETPDMSLDLGGIAKGYVADELAAMLSAANIEKAMINLGGNIYAYGEKEGGNPFKVAVQTPYDTRNTYFGYVTIRNKTVVTSGPYERYFEQDGTVYHHIFDAATGYPTRGETVSVSIIAESSMEADALSTLLFTMSPEDGLALIETMEGTECIYVDKHYGLRLSRGLKDNFVLTDDAYKIQ